MIAQKVKTVVAALIVALALVTSVGTAEPRRVGTPEAPWTEVGCAYQR